MATQTQVMAQEEGAQQANSTLLRRALRGNGVFSTISGVVFIVAAGSIATFLGLEGAEILGVNPATIVMVIGVGLLLFALGLFYDAAQDPLNAGKAMITVLMDVAWVVGSVILLVADPLAFSTEGKWVVLIIADIVATFAILQYVGVRRMR